jgi:hypothetical protein
MDKHDFINHFQENKEFYKEIPLITSTFEDDNELENVYEICRKTYELQLSADIFRTESGMGYQISENDFKQYAIHFNDFVKSIPGDKKEVYSETLELLKKYYKDTSVKDETKGKTFMDNNPSTGMAGHVGTLYFLDNMDWEYFEKELSRFLYLSNEK